MSKSSRSPKSDQRRALGAQGEAVAARWYEERGFATDASRFENGMDTGSFFKNEPENVFLVKMSYWFPI